MEAFSAGSSPHTRGARHAAARRDSRVRIIPAYAGSTIPYFSIGSRSPDHPRIRGEHSLGPGVSLCPLGSSPHTRGARLHQARPRRPGRIIPAYAGSTAGAIMWGRQQTDHPRIRGEHIKVPTSRKDIDGSSPHTRGARQRGTRRYQERRIIPAYAGSTSSTLRIVGLGADHPRIRGEHSAASPSTSRAAGSSPHTRGAPIRTFRISF